MGSTLRSNRDLCHQWYIHVKRKVEFISIESVEKYDAMHDNDDTSSWHFEKYFLTNLKSYFIILYHSRERFSIWRDIIYIYTHTCIYNFYIFRVEIIYSDFILYCIFVYASGKRIFMFAIYLNFLFLYVIFISLAAIRYLFRRVCKHFFAFIYFCSICSFFLYPKKYTVDTHLHLS